MVQLLIILNQHQYQASEKDKSPSYLSFGWQRARLLGAFFNGALLLALAVSVFLQSVERFISLHRWSSFFFSPCPIYTLYT